MTGEERSEILVTTRLLRACTPLLWLAIVLVGVTAFFLLRGTMSAALAILSIAAGMTALFYGIRTIFDARLFEDVLEERLTMQQLDAALHLKRAGRSWSDRCRGARRLPKVAAAAILVQLMALVFAAYQPAIRDPERRRKSIAAPQLRHPERQRRISKLQAFATERAQGECL